MDVPREPSFQKKDRKEAGGKGRKDGTTEESKLKDNVRYVCDSFLGIGFSGDRLWSIAAFQMCCDSNHGEAGKSDLLGGLKLALQFGRNELLA